MSKDYVVPAKSRNRLFRDRAIKGEARTYTFDFAAWAEDNTSTSSATWTVEHGNASISGQTLSSDIASALITFSETGGNLVKLSVDTGAEVVVVYLDVLVKEPHRNNDDYGIYS